jgi:hypothetical protein
MSVIEELIQAFDAEEIERPEGCRDGAHGEHWWPHPRSGRIACWVCEAHTITNAEFWAWRAGPQNRPIVLGAAA